MTLGRPDSGSSIGSTRSTQRLCLVHLAEQLPIADAIRLGEASLVDRAAHGRRGWGGPRSSSRYAIAALAESQCRKRILDLAKATDALDNFRRSSRRELCLLRESPISCGTEERWAQ